MYRALGLVTKYITGPWQRLAEQPNLGILDMNSAFQDGIIRLRKWSVDALPLVSGQAESIFNDVAIKKDVIFDSLTASRADDKRTADVLQNIISDFIPVYERQLHSQLLGGKYNNPSEKLLSEAASCSATNISGERVFVMLDFHTRRTPKAKLDHLEAKIMFGENKTGPWLGSKSTSQKACLIKAARKEAVTYKKLCHERHKSVLAEKALLLKEKQFQIAKKMLIKEN